jgi:hypothetical protein
MLNYFCQLSVSRVVLWCYLIWYSIAISLYFDASPMLWLTSLGIGSLMGLGMLMSSTGFPFKPTNLNRWQIFRFFFMPFCAASFSATVKDQGFVLVVFPQAHQTVLAVLACLAFCSSIALLKRFAVHKKPGDVFSEKPG